MYYADAIDCHLFSILHKLKTEKVLTMVVTKHLSTPSPMVHIPTKTITMLAVILSFPRKPVVIATWACLSRDMVNHPALRPAKDQQVTMATSLPIKMVTILLVPMVAAHLVLMAIAHLVLMVTVLTPMVTAHRVPIVSALLVPMVMLQDILCVAAAV